MLPGENHGVPLNRIRSARNGRDACPRNIYQTQGLHQVDEGVQFLGSADDLEDEALVGAVHHTGPENVGDTQVEISMSEPVPTS